MKKILILLIIASSFLYACQSSPSNKQSQSTLANKKDFLADKEENASSLDGNEVIIFYDDVKVEAAFNNLYLEIMPKNKEVEKPNFYISGSEKEFFDEKKVEGNVEYNTLDKNVNLNFLIGYDSCTGALDGPRVIYTFDLIKESVENLKIKEWRGCDSKKAYKPKLSKDELSYFAKSVYATIKEKYEREN